MNQINVTSGEYKGRRVTVLSLDAAIQEFGLEALDIESFGEDESKIVEYVADGSVVKACYDDGTEINAVFESSAEQAEKRAAGFNQKLA